MQGRARWMIIFGCTFVFVCNARCCIATDEVPIEPATPTIDFDWFEPKYALPETTAAKIELLPEAIRGLIGRRVRVHGEMAIGREGRVNCFFLHVTEREFSSTTKPLANFSMIVMTSHMQPVEKTTERLVAEGVLSVESGKDRKTGKYSWCYILGADSCHVETD